MVFGNVPKLHGLIALFAGAIAVAAGCSGDDFSGCKASRTCKPSGGAGGTGGSSGEGGAGSDTGGSNGSSGSNGKGGTGGNAGTEDGGAGTGGATDDTDPPTIVSFSPADGDIDVERDVEVTATFSEPIDANSISTTSVVLTGPDGDVPGTLGVDGDVVTFVADKPLYLLGDYTLTIGDGVADLAGNTLGEEASVGFKVRDGRWSEPTYPFGETVPRVIERFQRNNRGDIVVGIESRPSLEHVYAATYNATENRWTPATELRAMVGAQLYAYDVAVDDERHAVTTWGGYNNAGYGWSRFTEADGWRNAGPLPGFASVAISSNGLATAAYWDGSAYLTRTQDVTRGTVDPPIPVTISDASALIYLVSSLERVALITTRPSGTAHELTIAWKTASGWGIAEPIATASDFGTVGIDSDEEGNIIVAWRDNDEIWSRIYHRASDVWTRELFVATTTSDAILGRPNMTAGNAVVSFNAFAPDPGTWVAVYQEGIGWIEDSIVLLDDWTGGSVGLTIDAAGNALASWHAESKYRRYIAGSGWSASSSLQQGVDEYSRWAAEAPDGTIVVVGNASAASMSHVPWAVRFE